jgi:hypothetical protein
MELFADHGIKGVAYCTALDEPVKSSTFFYIQVVKVFHPAVGDPNLDHCSSFSATTVSRVELSKRGAGDSSSVG